MGLEEMLAGKEPFFWGGSSKQAVLCIHGFTGAPGLYRKLGRKLNEAGFAVSAPLLPGHGSHPEALIPVTAEQWIDTAKAAFQMLEQNYERVHVVGLSLGGAIATLLAACYADKDSLGKLVLMAPGYNLNPALLERIKPLMEADNPNHDRMIPLPSRQPKGDEMDECIFGYSAAPVVSVRQLQAVGRQALEAVPLIKTPTLLLYTPVDTVADPALCIQASKAFTTPTQVVAFEKSEHSLLLGCDREEVMSRTLEFFLR